MTLSGIPPGGQAPVNANSTAYTISLKPSVIKALLENAAGKGQNNEANVTVADSAITGSARYKITPLEATATLSNVGSYGKTYDATSTNEIDPAKLQFTTTVNGQTVVLNANGLTGSDFAWVGLTAGNYPKNVGTYRIELTDAGLAKLQADNPNFVLSKAGNGTYTISQAQGTATLSGSNEKTYNGQAITTAEINSNGQVVVNLTFPGSDASAKYTLAAGDYTITPNDADDSNLANAGTYTITLTDAGKANVRAKLEELSGKGQDNQANATVADSAISGNATFTINPSKNYVNVSGKQTETYTGSAINVIYDILSGNSVIVNFANDTGSTGSVVSPSGMNLNSGDFQIVDASGQPTTAINAGGVYHIVLTDAGVTKIQNAVGKNYQITQGTGFGTLEIDKAYGSVTFSGAPTYTYTGSANPDYLNGFSIQLNEPNNPTYKLVAGDIEFNVDGTWTKTAPINHGTYQVRLSQAGWNHIKAINSDNITWSATASAGTGTYTIKAATASTELSGNNQMVYNGNAVTTADLYTSGSTIKVVISGDNIANLPSTYQLTDGDYIWNTSDHYAPKNQGDYTITLTKSGLDKIQAAIDEACGKGNVTLSRDNTGKATFHIAQSVVSNLQLHGNEQSTYNGQAVQIDPSNTEFKENYGFNNSEGLTIPDMSADDFEWVDADGNVIAAPKDAGTYYLQLSKNGRDAIANANPNYTFVDNKGKSLITGKITYKVNPATLVIGVYGTASKVYDGQNAAVTQEQINNGDIKLVWGDGNTSLTGEPTDLGKFTLTPDDLEVVDANGHPVVHANASANETTGNPVYYVRLKSSVLNTLKGLTGAKNYDISLSNNSGNYLIYQHKAQVTLSGNQTTIYGTDLLLDATKYSVELTNWKASDGTKPDLTGILQDGDVYIDGYATTDKMPNGQLPKDVGTYQVMISSQLLNRLKQRFSDYNWDAVGEANGLTRDAEPGTGIVDKEHDPATYVIKQAEATVTINGAQHIKYGESANIQYGGTNGYTISITAPANGETKTIYANADFDASDLQFVTTPGDVGQYTVKLSATGLTKLAALTGSANYDWKQVTDDATTPTATFYVDQMPVTITVNNGTKEVTYGTSDWLTAIKHNPSGYTLTVKTNAGSTLEYTIQDGDLVFSQTPGNVGTYEVKLSAQGLANIKQALGTNYAYPQAASDVTTHGTFKVNQGTATVTLDGSDGKTYDGKATTSDDLHPNKYSYSATVYAPDGTAQTITLTNDDLQFVDAHGNAITPTSVGTYTVALSPSAETRLKNLTGNNGDNYQWTFKTNATYKITATSEASAALSGSNQKAFDGSGVTTAQINNGGSIEVKFTYPGSTDSSTYQLQDGDYDWYSEDGSTKLTSAPSQKGTYTIKLTANGLAHLQAALNALAGSGNVTLSADQLSGFAKFEITPKSISGVTISGNDQSKTYDGQAAGLDLSGLNISGTGTVSGTPLSKSGLIADDFDWYENGTKLTGAPTKVGNYEARLTDRALAALQNANPNYSFNEVNGTIKYAINPKAATDKLSGNGTKTYNGQGTSVTDVVHSVTWTPGGLVTGEHLDLSSLTNDDYEWYTKDAAGTYTVMTGLPTNVGTYYLKLKDSGIAKIKNANTNYSFADGAISGKFTYTIDKANAHITLPGTSSQGTSSQAITWTGNSATIDPRNFVPTITSDNPNAGTISLPSTLNLTAGDYQFLQGGRVIAAPSAVGTYQVQLTESGWHKVRDAIAGSTNYNWDYTGEGDYHINKADATISLNGSSSTIYSGRPAVIPSRGGTVTGITVTLSNGQTYDLRPTDLEFVNDRGGQIPVPTDAGNYKVRLTNAAVTAISGLDSDHYHYTYDHGAVDFAITQMPVTITVGDKATVPSVTYGQSITLNPGDYSITVKTADDTTLSYTPVAGDLQFADGIPTATGTFQVVLSNAGLQHIKDRFGTKNYTYSSTGHGSFTVKAATAGITINGSESKLYDGTAATLTPGDYHLVITTNNGQTINIPINAGDLVFSAGAAPVNVGTYDVTLSQSALDTIKREYANYDWGNPVAGQYTIKKARANVTTGGAYEVTYNGHTPTIDVGKITDTITTNNGVAISVPPLASDDFEWVDAAGNPIAAPANVGTYYLRLKDTSHSKVATNDNYDWNFSGLASVTINKASAAISFAGTDRETYTGSAIAPDPAKFTVTLSNGQTYSLTANDIQVVDNPVDVGTYHVELKQAAVDAINAADGNYDYAYDGSYGFLDIVPAATTAAISGSQTSKEAVLDPGKYTVTVLIGGRTHTISGLTAGDFVFSQGGHPTFLTTAGTYDVGLSGDAINRIRQDYPNYDITFSSTATFTLENSSQTVNYVDADNNVIKTTTLGNQLAGTEVPFTPALPIGWVLADPTAVPSTITIANGTTDISIKHGTTSVSHTNPLQPGAKTPTDKVINGAHADDLNQTITRTITIHEPDKAAQTITQEAHIYRDATYDDVTGEVTYGEWSQDVSAWKELNAPTVDGYTPSQAKVDAVTVKDGQKDVKVDITYTADDQSMTIDYVDKDGNPVDGGHFVVSGKTDQTVNTNAKIPTGWVLVPGQTDAPQTITFTGTPTANITITIEHGTQSVPHDHPVQPGDKTPTDQEIKGAHRDDLNRMVTRTINVDLPDGTNQQVVQTATIFRDATVDDVTGEVTYGAWSTDTTGWTAYTAPVVAGYTPDKSVAAASVDENTKDTTVNISYTANDQTGKIVYVDVDDDNKDVGHTELTGKTGETVTITSAAPAGYDIVSGQTIPDSVVAGADGIPTVTVKVQHHQITVTPGELPKPGDNIPGDPDRKPGDGKPKTKISYETLHRDMTRTINVTYPRTGLKTTKVTIHYERVATIDDVTGNVTYGHWTVANGSQAGFNKFNIPTVPGYTPEIKTGTAAELEALTPTQDQITNWQDQVVDIDYTTTDQTMHITYVDEAGHAVDGGSFTVTGKAGQTVNTNAKIPAGWVLAPGQKDAPKTITFGDTPTADITIKIEHGKTNVVHTDPVKPGSKTPTGKPIDGAHDKDLNQSITRTIIIHEPGKAPQTITQVAHIYRDATVDDVTGEVTYGDWSVDATDWAEVDVPVHVGYTPSQAKVDAVTVKNGQKDVTIDITYAVNEQTGKISYVDPDGNEVVHTDLAGKAGDTIAIDPQAPAGWKIVAGQNIPATVEAGPDGIPTVIVKVEHAMVTVDPTDPKTPDDVLPDNPTKHYPSGVDQGDLNKDITRTITVVEPDGTIIKKVQTVHLTRSATVDEVSGTITYSPWSTGRWGTYEAPQIPGYTPSQSEVVAKDVTSAMADENVVITYSRNDQDHGHNGQPTDDNKPGTPDTNNGKEDNDKNQPSVNGKPDTIATSEKHTVGTQTKSVQHKLPQTGNEKDSWSLVGLGLLSLLGLHGLRKKKRD